MTSLHRESLADQVRQHLLTMIREDALKPGDRLPSEVSLAQRFNVSRPVIREAMTHLKSLGIIGTQSGKLAVVRPVDSHLPAMFFEYAVTLQGAEASELLEVRRGLELQTAVLAAERATSAEVRKMRSLTRRMKTTLDTVDLAGFVDLDVQLHLLIARGSHNTLLVHLIEAIREPLRESVLVGLSSRSSADEVQYVHRVHEQIVAAIADRDLSRASLAMAEHFDKALLAIRHKHASESA